MEISLKEIAQILDGDIDGDADCLISGMAGIDRAEPLPTPSLIEIITVGKWCRSTRREATIPITP